MMHGVYSTPIDKVQTNHYMILLKDFQCLLQVLEHYGTVFGHESPFQQAVRERMKSTVATDTTDFNITQLCVSAAKKRYIAICFFKQAHS